MKTFFADADFKTPKMCSEGGTFNCVAVAISGDDAVGVRDTKTGETLQFTKAEWQSFVEAVKQGQFDA